MSEKKKVLIPGGRLSDWALINAAHKPGLYVISSGYRPDDPAHHFADKYIQADYADKEEMLRIAKEEKIDYMVANSNDFGLLSTVYVCEQLGLPGHDSYETTLKLHTKDNFKKVARELGLHSPVSEIFDNREAAIAYVRSKDEKLIIKPADNVGSNGVSVPENDEDIERCIDFAFEKSKSKKIVIEPFIEGFFVPATSFIINKKVVCFFTLGSYVYPQGGKVLPNAFPISDHCTGSSIPAMYADDFVPDIVEDFNKIAEYYDLVDGKLHCELLVTPDHKAYIFDIHRRMSGFFNPWSDWDITGEILWEEWIVKAECGMDLSDFPVGIKQNKFLHFRNIYAPKNGIIKRMVFDEYLSSRIFPKNNIKELVFNNMYVFDHEHYPLIDVSPSTGRPLLMFEFETKEELERMSDPNSDEFYSHIRFEYSDTY